METTRKLLTYDEVAELLAVSPRLARRLAESRRIESVKVGRSVRIPADAVDRYIEAQTRPATGGTQ